VPRAACILPRAATPRPPTPRPRRCSLPRQAFRFSGCVPLAVNSTSALGIRFSDAESRAWAGRPASCNMTFVPSAKRFAIAPRPAREGVLGARRLPTRVRGDRLGGRDRLGGHDRSDRSTLESAFRAFRLARVWRVCAGASGEANNQSSA
jgi:hypothetical protein